MTLDDITAELLDQLQTGSFHDKIQAIQVLGTLKSRTIQPSLLKVLAQNDAMAEYAIKSLAYLGDSRSFFPLMNIFKATEDPTTRQRILQYFYWTQDPRATEALEEYTAKPENPFVEIAATALEQCKDNPNFAYTFLGSDEHYEAARQNGRILVTNGELTTYEPLFEENNRGFEVQRPQTYVITTAGYKMYVGGILNEHVQVAQGEDVVAAGEVELEKCGETWEVKYINNRSTGYYPAASSFVWVKHFFEKQSDVRFVKTQFDEVFPTRGFNDPDLLSLFPFGENYKKP